MAFLNGGHVANRSGAKQGFRASRGVKGQRIFKSVAVFGLFLVMDGSRPHIQACD